MNLIEAKNLQYGNHLQHKTKHNKSGDFIRVKVNGQPKTWKRNPERVQIPYKYGLYEYGYICENELNEWDKI